MRGQVSLPADDDDLAAWQRVLSMPELVANAALAEEAAGGAGHVAAVAKLRALWPAREVAIALTLADARRRARAKFPSADQLVCDRQAVEQASSATVAAWKAERFADVDAPRGATIHDLCCGMGGDAMALAAKVPTVAIDRSAVRAWMASLNARCATRVADVTDLRFGGDLVHIDPARRIEATGARSRTPFHVPSIDACVAIVRSARGGAIKLGPGTEPEVLPTAPDGERSLEWISERGTLVQLVLWSGSLHRGAERMATRLAGDGTVRAITRTGVPEPTPRADGWKAMLAVPDPALERSRLLGGVARELGIGEPASGLGILTADSIPPSPWLERCEILARVSPNERAVADALRHLGATRARVRTRGGSADADAWTRSLARRLGGTSVGEGRELDLFLLRTGDERVALIARPLAERDAGSGS